MSNDDLPKFKGAKRIITELEQGEYMFKVIAKHPGVDSKMWELMPNYYEF